MRDGYRTKVRRGSRKDNRHQDSHTIMRGWDTCAAESGAWTAGQLRSHNPAKPGRRGRHNHLHRTCTDQPSSTLTTAGNVGLPPTRNGEQIGGESQRKVHKIQSHRWRHTARDHLQPPSPSSALSQVDLGVTFTEQSPSSPHVPPFAKV